MALGGTAIEDVDLSRTVVKSAAFGPMIFLERLTLPRHCVLGGPVGFPALRSLTFGDAPENWHALAFGLHVRDVRFESFRAPQANTPGLENARVHAEVAAVFTREANTSYPP